ncbi:MAG: DUF4892 domain-containing protein [Pseudomonadales bacterium]
MIRSLASLRLWLLLGLLIAPIASAAAADVPGSRDPFGLERYPRAWIVDYRRDEEVRPRDFVMSRVDRIRRDLRIEDLLRVDSTLESVTYRLPDGVSVRDAVAHYAEQLGSDLLFRCQGRGCGRSNDWANQVFNDATLYGPDTNQIYQASEWQGHLVALYAIERGNQRVYVHLRFLEPQGRVGLEPDVLLARRLAERGWAVIETTAPAADGSIDAAARTALGELAPGLERFAGQPLYLVCHLYGSGAADVLLAASQRCAETAVEALSAGMEGAPGERFSVAPFGAGTLLPRPGMTRPRLEIVVPGVVYRQRD